MKKVNQAFQSWIEISRELGEDPRQMQGGGGNSSFKEQDGVMYIKGSGYGLRDLREDRGFARLDYVRIADAVQRANADSASIDAAIESARIEPDDEPRPSLEAGLHSVLGRAVIHSYSFFANLLACNKEAGEQMGQVLGDDLEAIYIPDCHIGSLLALDILKRFRELKLNPAEGERLILVQNHGLIATADSPKAAAELLLKASRRIRLYFDLPEKLMTDLQIDRLGENHFRSASLGLIDMLRVPVLRYETLVDKAIYPNQIVLLRGALEFKAYPKIDIDSAAFPFFEKSGRHDALSTSAHDRKAYLDPDTGISEYFMNYKQALATEETIYTVTLHHKILKQKGWHVAYLSPEQFDFISNWDREKYRKAIQEG